MAVNRFLHEELARTRPSEPEIASALAALDKKAAQRFALGDYRNHFRDDKNFWSREARAESWALAYIAYGSHLEKAARDTQRLSHRSSFSSPWADREMADTLLHGAFNAGVSVLGVAMAVVPVYQEYLEGIGLREAPFAGQLATSTAEVAIIEAYQRAAVARVRGSLVYNTASRVATSPSFGHFLADTLTFILYADAHENLDAAAYQAAVNSWLGREDALGVLRAADAGATLDDVERFAADGISPEYALALLDSETGYA